MVFVLASCASTQFMKTGDETFSQLGDNCEFKIYTTNPKKEFDEIGLVEFGGIIENLSSLKKEAAPYVCRTGGNAILAWEVNGYGRYLKATIIRTK